MDDSTLSTIMRFLPLLIPILLIQVGLQIYALIDLVRQPAEALRGPKWMWAVIILLLELFGPIIYFFLSKKNE